MKKGTYVDSLLALVRFELLVLGLTYILTRSTIFGLVRVVLLYVLTWIPAMFGTWLAVLLYCPACASFWIALVLAKWHLWPLHAALWGNLDAAVCSCGLIAVVTNNLSSDVWDAERAVAARHFAAKDQPRDQT